MIPIKLISKEQAIKLGLEKNPKKQKGKSGFGIGIIVQGGDGKPERIIEKHLIKQNGEKELIFMSNERKADFKNKGNLKDYVKQFKKVPENVKKDIN